MPLISKTPLEISTEEIKSINSQSDGSVTLTIDDAGNVLSVQPDGSFQTRPKGTAGAYEKARISGNFVIYKPADKSYVFALI